MHKHKKMIAITLVAISTLGIGCSANPYKLQGKTTIQGKVLSEPVEKISSANNKTAFKMLNYTFDANKGVNTVISPLSMNAVLSIIQNGAASKTKEEMLRALEMKGLEDGAINESYRNIIANYNSISSIQVKMANSIWIGKDMQLKEDFKSKGRDNYEAEINQVDFSKKDTTDTINQWVSQNTAGKIKKVVDGFDSDTSMALINTVYFNGDWAMPFEKASTYKQEFTGDDGNKLEVDMMHKTFNIEYLKTNNFKAVRIPYKESSFGMYIFLPDDGSDVGTLIKQMSFENWNKVNSKFTSKKIVTAIPKFHIEFEQNLNDMLKNFGMKLAFDPQKSDFSNMTESAGLYIDLVKQKCFIDVDEKGTEAVAATIATMKTTSAMVEKLEEFIVDRPFVYAIADSNTGIIMFMGTVEKP
jgi:serine protease inhibitor